MSLRATSVAAAAIAAVVILGSSAGPSHAFLMPDIGGAIEKKCKSSLTNRVKCGVVKVGAKVVEKLDGLGKKN